jgi:transcriptional regulator with XRE-family HTH domain
MQRVTRPGKPSPFGKSLRELRVLKQYSLRRLSGLTSETGNGEPLDYRYIDQLETGQIQVPGANQAARLATALSAQMVLRGEHMVLEISKGKRS